MEAPAIGTCNQARPSRLDTRALGSNHSVRAFQLADNRLQAHECTRQTGLDGAAGDAQHLGHLRFRQVQAIAAGENPLIGRTQAAQSFQELLAVVLAEAFGLGGCGRTRRVQLPAGP